MECGVVLQLKQRSCVEIKLAISLDVWGGILISKSQALVINREIFWIIMSLFWR